MRRLTPSLLLTACLLFTASTAQAQQTIGHIDSQKILKQMPEYETVQQKVDQLAKEWRNKLEKRQKEVDEMFKEYQAREMLYTDEERKKKRESIMQAEKEVEQMRSKYFGPEGQLFTRQKELMRPLQERILTAVESIAEREGYDYVFDKAGGEVLFMYADSEHSLNDDVLGELGIDTEQQQTRSNNQNRGG
jgi:outer membrane protein